MAFGGIWLALKTHVDNMRRALRYLGPVWNYQHVRHHRLKSYTSSPTTAPNLFGDTAFNLQWIILSFCVSPPPSLLRNSVAGSHRTCNTHQLSQKPMLVLIFLPLLPKCLTVGHKLHQHNPSYTSQSYTHTTELYTIKTSGKLASLYWTRLKRI